MSTKCYHLYVRYNECIHRNRVLLLPETEMHLYFVEMLIDPRWNNLSSNYVAALLDASTMLSQFMAGQIEF